MTSDINPEPPVLLPRAPYLITLDGIHDVIGLYVRDQGFLTITGDEEPAIAPLEAVMRATLMVNVFVRDVLEVMPGTTEAGDETPYGRMASFARRLRETPAAERDRLINPIGPPLRFSDLDPAPVDGLSEFAHLVTAPAHTALVRETAERLGLESGDE